MRGYAFAEPAGRPWRPGPRSLVAVLVLLIAVGARVYFLIGSDSPDTRATAGMAAAINLRSGDLPSGWAIRPPSADPAGSADNSGSGGASDADSQAFDRDIARCIGAADPTTSTTFAASSPSWTRGASEISSDVTVTRSTAIAQQDLRAQQSPKVAGCVGRAGTPALRSLLASKGVQLTALSVARLPGAPKDEYALRMKMTMAANGRTVTVFTDTYGFVRGKVEVDLTMVSTGAAPDMRVAGKALVALRGRATKAATSGS
jgi:hypothetical protein